MGTKNRSPKGTVSVESNDGRLRLRWRYHGKRYAIAVGLPDNSVEPEAILRRFTRNNVQHPTYQALGELGKVLKTILVG